MSAPPRIASLSSPQVLELSSFTEARGRLCVAEATQDVPFDIERVYWISDVPGASWRGGHAHRTVSEALIAVAGEFSVRCELDGEITDFRMQDPGRALLLPPTAWRVLSDFSPGAICLVLASAPYDKDEYILERDELSRFVRDS